MLAAGFMDKPARTFTLITIQIAPFWDVVIYGNYAIVESLCILLSGCVAAVFAAVIYLRLVTLPERFGRIPCVPYGERSEYNRAEEIIFTGCNRCDSCDDSDYDKKQAAKVVFHNYFLSVTLIFGYKKCTLFGCCGHCVIVQGGA